MALNNTQIHQTLPNANVRDHLALMIEQNWSGLSVQYIEAEIKKLQADLQRCKAYEAAESMIQHLGWKQHDLSGETVKDGEYWLPFIGTQEEYEQVKAVAESQRQNHMGHLTCPNF